MYEDTPQELVHDLFSEAVFGDHPLGRPVIGTAEVISSVSRRALSAYHRTTYAPGTSSSRRPGTSSTTASSRSAAERRAQRRAPAARGTGRVRRPLVAAAAARASASSARRPSSTTSASARPASRARTAAASPPRCSTRSSAARPRRGSSRRSARSAAWRTPSTASCRSTRTPARSASTSARARRTSPLPRDRVEQIAEIAAGSLRTGELERAKENLKGRIVLSLESTSNRMSRLGSRSITDTELLSLERIMAEIDAVEPDELAELAAVLLRPSGSRPRASGPTRRFRAAVARASPTLVERQPREDRVLRRRREGRPVLVAALEAAGHEVRGIELGTSPTRAARRRGRLHDARRGPANVRAALEQGVSCVVGTTGWDPAELGALARRRASRCSSRRTSRSARC